jgi:ribosome-binding ATPase YchF (GTP1/OBG family)
VPFVTGGAELHVRSLIDVLRQRGHDVDLVALPFRSQPKEDLLAQAAAGEIHSDIQRGFIRAEVVAYDALTGRGSMAACREHGEVRLEGKEYVVQDGDIINFRFAT